MPFKFFTYKLYFKGYSDYAILNILSLVVLINIVKAPLNFFWQFYHPFSFHNPSFPCNLCWRFQSLLEYDIFVIDILTFGSTNNRNIIVNNSIQMTFIEIQFNIYELPQSWLIPTHWLLSFENHVSMLTPNITTLCDLLL